jgi:hypothetical protein
MKFKTLNGREIRMEILPERYPVRTREQCKSAGQYMLGRLLRSIYGFHALILEEFPLPEERLYLDFFMPHNKLGFEYQGIQHDKFVKLFHSDKKGFEKSKARDARKRLWCETNEITLIEVRGNVSVEELQKLIEEARNE